MRARERGYVRQAEKKTGKRNGSLMWLRRCKTNELDIIQHRVDNKSYMQYIYTCIYSYMYVPCREKID